MENVTRHVVLNVRVSVHAWRGSTVISITFCGPLLWMSPRIINGLRSHTKNSKECFIRCPNPSKSVKKNTRQHLAFLTHFLVFGYPDPRRRALKGSLGGGVLPRPSKPETASNTNFVHFTTLYKIKDPFSWTQRIILGSVFLFNKWHHRIRF